MTIIKKSNKSKLKEDQKAWDKFMRGMHHPQVVIKDGTLLILRRK